MTLILVATSNILENYPNSETIRVKKVDDQKKKREKRQPTKLIFPPIATIYCALKAWYEQLEYSRGSKQLITPLLIRLMGWGIREFFCKLTGIIQMTLCY